MYCDMLKITTIYCERMPFPDSPFLYRGIDKGAAPFCGADADRAAGVAAPFFRKSCEFVMGIKKLIPHPPPRFNVVRQTELRQFSAQPGHIYAQCIIVNIDMIIP